jgi:hypothetical protein
MLKKIAAIGVSVAIAFSPLAALAQTDQAAPAPGAAPAAGDQGSMATPMKKKTHHHMSSSKMKKPMAPSSAPAGGAPAGGAPAANPQ